MEKQFNLYDANNDVNLINQRNLCKNKCLEFNSISFSDNFSKQNILDDIFGKHFENINITAPFWCDYGKNISMGKNFFANHNLIILDAEKVEIGDNVYIAPNCCISTAGHPTDYETRNQGLEYALPIKIGNNVWIGANVSILPGVTIGSNVVIGAGSVVNKDIKPNSVAVGVPCKVIKNL